MEPGAGVVWDPELCDARGAGPGLLPELAPLATPTSPTNLQLGHSSAHILAPTFNSICAIRAMPRRSTGRHPWVRNCPAAGLKPKCATTAPAPFSGDHTPGKQHRAPATGACLSTLRLGAAPTARPPTAWEGSVLQCRQPPSSGCVTGLGPDREFRRDRCAGRQQLPAAAADAGYRPSQAGEPPPTGIPHARGLLDRHHPRPPRGGAIARAHPSRAFFPPWGRGHPGGGAGHRKALGGAPAEGGWPPAWRAPPPMGWLAGAPGRTGLRALEVRRRADLRRAPARGPLGLLRRPRLPVGCWP